jgi:hypothetical protein
LKCIAVLSSGNNTAAVTTVNETLIPELCGANFLPSADAAEALPHQPPEKIRMIAGFSTNYLLTANGTSDYIYTLSFVQILF